MKLLNLDAAGWVSEARRLTSPNADDRPDGMPIELVVIHNISLPPGEYGGSGVLDLFTNRLDPAAHPYYGAIQGMKVSAHFFIRRDGELIQFVACGKRAWHAGVSSWQGRERCNDFSIGIELEGCDEAAFEEAQYDVLESLLALLRGIYPIVGIVGHSEIAPGRKTDPGPGFDWSRVAGR